MNDEPSSPEYVPSLEMSTSEHTANHLTMHYARALQELVNDGIVASADGITRFAVGVVVGDCYRRSSMGRVPWDVVLHHVFHQAMTTGTNLENAGKLNGAVPRTQQDLDE